jgi:hypothetical protein
VDDLECAAPGSYKRSATTQSDPPMEPPEGSMNICWDIDDGVNGECAAGEER